VTDNAPGVVESVIRHRLFGAYCWSPLFIIVIFNKLLVDLTGPQGLAQF
jgi:hypothetical protein